MDRTPNIVSISLALLPTLCEINQHTGYTETKKKKKENVPITVRNSGFAAQVIKSAHLAH